MEASKAMRKALKSIDMDLACGAYERLPTQGQKELKAATVDFLYKYCKILKDGLGYSRSGDKYGWRDRWLWLYHRICGFLQGKDTQGQGGSQVAGKARRHRIYKAIEGYHRRVVGRKPTDKGEYTGNDTKPTGEDREAGEAGQGLAGAVGRTGYTVEHLQEGGVVVPQVPTHPQGGQVSSGGGIQKADQMKISENFDLREVEYSHTAVYLGIDNAAPHDVIANARKFAAIVLQPIREKIGMPFDVTSWYRSPQLNKAIGGVSTSAHLTGMAVDFTVRGMTAKESFEAVLVALKDLHIPFDQLILEHNPKTGGRWVHLGWRKQGNRNESFTLTK